MDFTLRQAGPADIDAVMALETAGFPPGIVEDRGVFVRRLEVFSPGFLLAETSKGQPFGYFCTEIWAGWDLRDLHRFDLGHDIVSFLEPAGDTLYVASMTIDPEFRGLNLGRDLLCQGLVAMTTSFPALTQSVLIVNEHWLGARKIYCSEGFAEIGRLDKFFRPDRGPWGDALVMTRSFSK